MERNELYDKIMHPKLFSKSLQSIFPHNRKMRRALFRALCIQQQQQKKPIFRSIVIFRTYKRFMKLAAGRLPYIYMQIHTTIYKYEKIPIYTMYSISKIETSVDWVLELSSVPSDLINHPHFVNRGELGNLCIERFCH